MLAQMSVAEAAGRTEADFFVVEDLANLGQRNVLAAQLSGGVVCTYNFIQSCGAAGPCTAFKPAFEIQRKIFISANFIVRHPIVSNFLIDMMQSPRSRWSRCLCTMAEFNAIAAKLCHQKRSTVAIAFIASDEKTLPEVSNVKNVITSANMYTKFNVLDMTRCRMGACSR
jgi:hypothetical protein